MSASRSATSSGAIASRMSEARSTSRRSRMEACICGSSISSRVSAAFSSSRAAKTALAIGARVRLQTGGIHLQAELLVVPAAHHRPIERAYLSAALQDDAGDPGKRLGHHHHEVSNSSDAMLSNVDDLSVEEIAEEDQTLASELLEEQGRVVPAEAERVRQCQLDVHLARALRDVVEAALRVRVLEVDSGRRDTLLDGFHRDHCLNRSRGAEQ